MKTLPPEHRHNGQWCEKHWAPYRDPGANGVYAAVAIMQAFLDSPLYAELTDKSPAALNRVMEEGDTALCRRLGEEVMDKILAEAKKLGEADGPGA